MKVIIDGGDLTGKTTLINKLKNYYSNNKLSFLHFSYNDRRDYNFYNTMLDKNNFISDRHFLDEMIYPFIFNRKQELSHDEFLALLNKCKNEDIKIIILTCSNEELLKRLISRGEDEEEVKKNLLLINNMFINMAKMHNLKLINTEITDLSEIIKFIEGDKNEKYKSSKTKRI